MQMYFDLEKLKQARTIDPFSMPPVEISESLAFTAGIILDNSMDNLKVRAFDGVAVSRIFTRSPTPRMRQLLAVLGWAPLRPASDDVWILDEPVVFPPGANHLVCDFVARYYAEEMTLLFAPDDGLFEGGGAELEAAGDRRDELGAHLRLLAERRYVALAWAAPTVPPSVLHRAVAKDVVKLNAVRRRYRLAQVAAPSAATIGRWLPAIRERHAGREGVDRDWEDRLPRT